MPLTHFLEYRTPFLNSLTEYYYSKDAIRLPADYMTKPSALQAAVGLNQLQKYDRIIARRQALARIYCDHLKPLTTHWSFPPHQIDGTYSHFPILLKQNRDHRAHN